MYCQSCQTKLSPRDTSCPTCGRRAAGGNRSLGDSSAGNDSKQYPLSPSSSMDDDSSGTDLSGPGSSQRAAAPPERRESRPAEARPAPSQKPAPPATPPEPSHSGGASAIRPADVRRMLIDQPGLIEDGLEVYSEKGELVGVGYSTAVGDIDVLARDDAGGWVVVCIPDSKGKDIVSDLLQRMGWVRRHLGQSGEEVRGIVLLDELPDDLGYAAAAVSDSVEFKLYQMALTLESVIV